MNYLHLLTQRSRQPLKKWPVGSDAMVTNIHDPKLRAMAEEVLKITRARRALETQISPQKWNFEPDELDHISPDDPLPLDPLPLDPTAGLTAGLTAGQVYQVVCSSKSELLGEWAAKVQHVQLPEGLVEIQMNAFENCPMLTTVDFGSVTKIGVRAFKECTGLRTICLPNKLKSIGIQAFQDCSGLNSIRFLEGVEEIGTCAFDRCTGLTTLIFPKSLKQIYSLAFRNCSRLKVVDLCLQGEINDIQIDLYAFKQCTSLAFVVTTNELKHQIQAIANSSTDNVGAPIVHAVSSEQ